MTEFQEIAEREVYAKFSRDEWIVLTGVSALCHNGITHGATEFTFAAGRGDGSALLFQRFVAEHDARFDRDDSDKKRQVYLELSQNLAELLGHHERGRLYATPAGA